jgi:hypothetical protein
VIAGSLQAGLRDGSGIGLAADSAGAGLFGVEGAADGVTR